MKIFVDSGIFIEYLKGRKVNFFEYLIQQDHQLFINQVVLSEFLFHFIAAIGNKSPLAIKESGKIADCLKNQNPIDMLTGIQFCNHTAEISLLAIDFAKQFNLLPNDALILATCKFYDLKYLVTFDSDFEAPCKSLGIRIFSDETDLKNFIPRIKLNP
ncbi:MAG: type II toxin-antitoxin system VapC family toxin [Bacteroidales bacterium]